MLSSLQGTAISGIKIEGADHEYSTIQGVKEDVIDIILNLKSVVLKGHTGFDKKRLTLSAVGPCTVTAGMIEESNDLSRKRSRGNRLLHFYKNYSTLNLSSIGFF